jgi:hypothetical protein
MVARALREWNGRKRPNVYEAAQARQEGEVDTGIAADEVIISIY